MQLLLHNFQLLMLLQVYAVIRQQHAIAMAITEAAPDALAGYAFKITETVDNIDNVGTVTANVSTTDVENFGLAAKAKSGTTGFAGTSPNFTYTFNSAALTVQNGERTQYTYTLASTTGVTGTGIVSAISQKSDYLAGQVNGQAFGAKTTVVFIVNPAPATGPIYHIANDFAY